jgi:hypothetical protein
MCLRWQNVLLVAFLLVGCGCSKCNSPETWKPWKEDPEFAEAVRNMTNLACLIDHNSPDYPNTDSADTRRLLDGFMCIYYFYPPRHSQGPFDLIWAGPNGIFEGGKGDDVPIRAVAERLCTEDGYWIWRIDDMAAQGFYDDWRKRAEVRNLKKGQAVEPPPVQE